LNSTKVADLIPRDEGNSVTSSLCPARSADAVNVVFREGGDIEIYDVGDACDIDSAGGDIRSNHNAVISAFEAIHCAFPLALVTTRVDSHGDNVSSFKVALNFVCAVLGAGEDQDAGQLAIPEEVQKKTDFLVSFDEIDVLVDSFDGVSGPANLNHQRRFLDSCGEGAYFRSYSGGEEHSLAIFWHSGDDFLDVPDETHIEHSVGLIENEHLDAPEVYGALAHMVEEPARSCNNDINALTKRGKLAFDIHAAINGESPQVQETTIAENELFDLHSQLTSRGKDK
jgi:hypothetical protein